MTTAPEEMLRHREGDCASMTMAQEKQRTVRARLLECR